MTFIQNHLFQVAVWSLMAALLVYGVFKFGTQWRGFINEVALELSKCSWPWNPQEKGMKRYKELIDSTVVVAVSSLLYGGGRHVVGFYFTEGR